MASGPLAPLFIPWIDYLIGGSCSGQRIHLAQGQESFSHLVGVTCARTHLSWSLLDPMAALSPWLPPLSVFLREKPFFPNSCLLNECFIWATSCRWCSHSPAAGMDWETPGTGTRDLRLESPNSPGKFWGAEPTSPPCWPLHHLELITCTCGNLLGCSFPCWVVPPAAAEGLELLLQGPAFGI